MQPPHRQPYSQSDADERLICCKSFASIRNHVAATAWDCHSIMSYDIHLALLIKLSWFQFRFRLSQSSQYQLQRPIRSNHPCVPLDFDRLSIPASGQLPLLVVSASFLTLQFPISHVIYISTVRMRERPYWPVIYYVAFDEISWSIARAHGARKPCRELAEEIEISRRPWNIRITRLIMYWLQRVMRCNRRATTARK